MIALATAMFSETENLQAYLEDLLDTEVPVFFQQDNETTERATSLQRFQQSQAEFLIATDIASRGLDLPCTKTVINFHLPVDVTRYIHRVGRTDLLGHGAAPGLQLAGAETDWMQFRDQVEAFLAECLALLPQVPKEVVAVGCPAFSTSFLMGCVWG
eukprot:s2057_g7.t1